MTIKVRALMSIPPLQRARGEVFEADAETARLLLRDGKVEKVDAPAKPAASDKEGFA